MSRPEIIRQLRAHASAVIQAEPAVWTADYRLPQDFLGFMGHFPGNPVLPALLQVAMVRLVIEEALGMPCFLDIRHAKFSAPIRPGAVITVQAVRGEATWKAMLLSRQEGADAAETAATLSVIPVPRKDERRDA